MTDHDHMQRARGMLAEQWRERGWPQAADQLIAGHIVPSDDTDSALAAIAAALRSQDEAAQVSDVTRQLIERDHRGAAKYGTTLDRTDLSLPDWLQHMAEELMDAAGYALAAKRTAEAVPEGWQLVPVEATPEMETANAMYGDTSDWWNAVLTAAPNPEQAR